MEFTIMIKRLAFILISIFITQSARSQKHVVDSLMKKEYSDLNLNFGKVMLDSLTAVNHALAYLKKGKLENDLERIADGYYFLARISTNEKSLKYCDSIIALSKNIKNSSEDLVLAYEYKGLVHHQSGNFDQALSYYLEALDHTDKQSFHNLRIKFDIAALKYRSGYREEAKHLFYNYLNEITNYDIPNKKLQYEVGLYAYADALIYTGKLDSAETVINRGLKATQNSTNGIIHSRFLLNSGINSYYQKKYDRAVDSLRKSLNFIKNQNDNLTLAINYSYLGKSLYSKGNEKDAIAYFLKVHDHLEETHDVAEELLETYPMLIDYYKSRKDYPNQLLYINALMKFDSIFNFRSKQITQKISKNYDIPNLISEKENLIRTLEDKDNLNRAINSILIFFSIGVSIFGFYFFKKSRLQKQRFDLIIREQEIDDSNPSKSELSENLNRMESAGISQELLDKILPKLEQFERSQKYLKKTYTLNSLAKELNTNSSYLSKVINIEKNTNFSNYLNNLKIDYAIKRLTSDPKFRLYNLNAISEESGFNNRQTFANAFHKKTKLNLSYFIKQLESNK